MELLDVIPLEVAKVLDDGALDKTVELIIEVLIAEVLAGAVFADEEETMTLDGDDESDGDDDGNAALLDNIVVADVTKPEDIMLLEVVAVFISGVELGKAKRSEEEAELLDGVILFCVDEMSDDEAVLVANVELFMVEDEISTAELLDDGALDVMEAADAVDPA